MLVRESLVNILKPKSKEEIGKNLEEKIRNIPIREDAIYEVVGLLDGNIHAEQFYWGYNDVSREIIDYISDNEFYDALIYILKNNKGLE